MTRLIIVNSEKFGLSPIERNFNIVWAGAFSKTSLVVDLQETFGFGLTDIFINGSRFPPNNSGHFEKDVKDLLKQGDNKLTIVFNAPQIIGQPLGATQITAFLDYFGAHVLQTPSISQIVRDIETAFTKNIPTTIAIIFGIAVTVAAVAYISSRLPSAGKVDIGDLGSKAKESFQQSTSHLKHAIMSIKGKM